ncbi:MAG: phospholipase D-like domain-containing protein [bacterium]
MARRLPSPLLAAALLCLTGLKIPSSAAAYGNSPALVRLEALAGVADPAPAATPLCPVQAASQGEKPPGLPPFVFSGQADIAALIASSIDNSRTSVEAALYGLTLQGVAEALVRAKNRGVAVRVIMNESHALYRRSREVQFLLDNGVKIRTLRGSSKYGIMHNKLAIFDSRAIVTGSFNWSTTANTINHENAIFNSEDAMVKGYRNYWNWMWTHTRAVSEGPGPEVPYEGYGPPPADPDPSVNFNGAVFPSYSFSPAGPTQMNLLTALKAAEKSVDAAVFSFYSQSVADALVEAHERGVRVRIVVDKLQGNGSPLTKFLLDNGIKLKWSQGPGAKGVMHHKFAVFDGKMLETGSHNWTGNAQYNNFENVFYSVRPLYAGGYSAEFEKIYAAATIPTPAELELILTRPSDSFPDCSGSRTGLITGDFSDDPSYDLEPSY